MKAPLAITAAALLLTGCVSAPIGPASVAQAQLPVQAACAHGGIDAQRSFVLCPAGEASVEAVRAAMAQPVDPSLDLAAVAADYGVGQGGVAAIQPATYSQITGRTKERRPRATRKDSSKVTVGTRELRRVPLRAEGRDPAVLFIED